MAQFPRFKKNMYSLRKNILLVYSPAPVKHIGQSPNERHIDSILQFYIHDWEYMKRRIMIGAQIIKGEAGKAHMIVNLSYEC